MTDVRLTATNPDDSSVVPVGCNSRGELLIVQPVIEQIDNDVTINGALRTTPPDDYWSSSQTYIGIDMGSGDLCGSLDRYTDYSLCLTSNGYKSDDGYWKSFDLNGSSAALQVELDPIGAEINFRLGGLWNDFVTPIIPRRFYIDFEGGHTDNLFLHREGLERKEGQVIEVGAELQFLRDQVRSLMERLKMTPEGGWEVWDGSTES